MTVRERAVLDVLMDHVLELKEDMGQVKSDVASLKSAQGDRKENRKGLRAVCVSIGCVCLGALPGFAHTYLGWGQS